PYGSCRAPSYALKQREIPCRKQLSLSESGPRVEAIVDRPEPRFEHVCVDLCGREVGVAEHQLDRTQVRAALEQMRGERVAQHVRAERARQVGFARVLLENLPEPDAAQRAAARVHEQAR